MTQFTVSSFRMKLDRKTDEDGQRKIDEDEMILLRFKIITNSRVM